MTTPMGRAAACRQFLGVTTTTAGFGSSCRRHGCRGGGTQNRPTVHCTCMLAFEEFGDEGLQPTPAP
jgi:hypothetical protein